ncbi:unnamed protein product [Brugia timori]|uniref:Uncharacterized protein n=1 Tax=Brugia timori TaxID=42155 RepID=A0A0R3QZW6_9BILA|nr:unnamed protein product [Brugia timori]
MTQSDNIFINISSIGQIFNLPVQRKSFLDIKYATTIAPSS